MKWGQVIADPLSLKKVVFSNTSGYLAMTSPTAKRGGGAGWQRAQKNGGWGVFDAFPGLIGSCPGQFRTKIR